MVSTQITDRVPATARARSTPNLTSIVALAFKASSPVLFFFFIVSVHDFVSPSAYATVSPSYHTLFSVVSRIASGITHHALVLTSSSRNRRIACPHQPGGHAITKDLRAGGKLRTYISAGRFKISNKTQIQVKKKFPVKQVLPISPPAIMVLLR